MQKDNMRLVKRGFQLWWVWDDAEGYHAKKAASSSVPQHLTFQSSRARDRFINKTEYLAAFDQ